MGQRPYNAVIRSLIRKLPASSCTGKEWGACISVAHAWSQICSRSRLPKLSGSERTLPYAVIRAESIDSWYDNLPQFNLLAQVQSYDKLAKEGELWVSKCLEARECIHLTAVMYTGV